VLSLGRDKFFIILIIYLFFCLCVFVEVVRIFVPQVDRPAVVK
jgi:hypothetical protein